MELTTHTPEAIFTHESDLDGFVSGLLLQKLAYKLFGRTVPLYAYNIQAWHHRNHQEPTAWVSDLAVNASMDRPGWILIDHHPLRHQPRHAQLIHDLNKSSTALVYELCKQHGLQTEALDRLVHLCNIADLFQIDHPDFPEASDYAALIRTYQFWNLYKLIEGDPEKLLNHPLLQVMRQRRLVEDPIGIEWSLRHIHPITDQIGYVEIAVGNPSLILHRLLDHPDLPYAVLCTLWEKPNGTIVVSFRSKQGEAGPLAEQLHGGGHPNAAAAVLPRSVRSVSQALEFLRNFFQHQEKPLQLPTDSMDAMAELFAEWDAQQEQK